MVTIDVKQLYGEVAKLEKLPEYVAQAFGAGRERPGRGSHRPRPGMALPGSSPRPARAGEKPGL